MNPRTFLFPDSEQVLILSSEALETFSKYQQVHNESEAGGILLAEFHLPKILIANATPPHTLDKRTRYSFWPNRFFQRRNIQKEFKQGRHFVGEWHTHPEPFPSPSEWDKASMSDSFLQSKHNLNFFVMIIVGNSTEALNLWVSVHDGTTIHQLHEKITETYKCF